ncbi:hypothetical protein NT6N_07370 [Oceaniferula spumae]|uniref:Ice-binding protein C-terminal domain-containing protein n=1 Tax=Oceaniferula spumae TaxID=2979115 RepID=A0AAT9FIB2_9BACT
MSKKLFLKILYGPLGLAIMASQSFGAITIIDEDFTGLSGALPNDAGNPVDNQDEWFRIGGHSSVDFGGTVDGSAIHMGFRYQNTNANFVSASVWDTSTTYAFSFDYVTSNTQLGGTLPSWIIGAGSGTDRFAANTIAGGDLNSTAGSHNVSITINQADLLSAGVTSGDNIYIRIEKPGSGGNGRSAIYEIDNVLLVDNVPEPSSTALLGLGAIGFLLRRRR